MGGDWGFWGLELEDSPGPEVQALLEGGALRIGLGCGGDGGVGPTLVSYLHGAGAGAARTVEATTAAAAGGMAGALWLAAAMAVGAAAAAKVGGGAVAAVSGPGLDPPAGGGEERRTRGLKLCPPRVLTMPGPDKGRRWREWEEEDFFAKEEKGFEMKMKRGGGGGGGAGVVFK